MKWLKQLFLDPEFRRQYAFFSRLPLFAPLSRRQFGYLQENMVDRTYEVGETLFLEGDMGRALFIIETGKIEIYRKSENGSEKSVAVMGAGEFFGEMSLIDELPRTASARVIEPARIFLLYKSEVETLADQSPILVLHMFQHISSTIAQRLRSVGGKPHHLSNLQDDLERILKSDAA